MKTEKTEKKNKAQRLAQSEDDLAGTSRCWAESVRRRRGGGAEPGRREAALPKLRRLSASYIFSKCDTDGRLEVLIRVRN